MGYKQELDALQRWFKSTAGLNSFRLSEAPPKVARPVALLETPNRRNDRIVSHYTRTRRTAQYGTLYVKNLDQLADLIDSLETDIDARQGLIPLFENSTAAAVQIGYLKAVQIELNNSDKVDVPFTIRYEATYSRPKPTEAPKAGTVVNKTTYSGLNN